MAKEFLRNKFVKIRNEIRDKELKSNIIANKILNNEFYKKSKVIALYSSLPSEVNTFSLIKHSLDNKKTVALPCIVSKSKMEFYKINTLEDINCIGSLGIKEPYKNERQIINKSDIDVMIIPGICFDKSKNRIGFGNGYYDRYLEDADNIMKIGICFNEQTLTDGDINFNEHDIKMDMVITDKVDIK